MLVCFLAQTRLPGSQTKKLFQGLQHLERWVQVMTFFVHWQNSWPKLGAPVPLKSAIMSICVRYLIPEYVIPNMSWMRLGAAPKATVLLHSLLKPAENDRPSARSFSALQTAVAKCDKGLPVGICLV